MGIEFRGNHAYYYEKEWVGGRCVSRYCGGGEMAALCDNFAQLMAPRRHHARDNARVAAEAEAEKVAKADRRFEAYFRAVQDLADRFMVANGYHRPSRHRWRKRWMSKRSLPAPGASKPPEPKARTVGDAMREMTDG